MNTPVPNPLVATRGLVSLYRQIEDRLREEIASGRFKEGDLIPSELELAGRYGVSQGTVRKAMLNLTQEGVFYRKQGKGTFVVFQKKGHERYRNFRFVNGFETNLLDLNMAFKGAKVIQAPVDVAETLGMPKGGKVIRLERTGKFGGIGQLHTLSFLPFQLYPGLDKYTAEDFKKNTLWKLQEIYFGIRAEDREEFISAVVADEKLARQVGTASGAAVLRIDLKLTAFSGECVEYRRTHIHLSHLKYYRRFLNNPRVDTIP